MHSTSFKQRIVIVCLLFVGVAASYYSLASEPLSLSNFLSSLAVVSFVVGLALSPSVLFGPVTFGKSESGSAQSFSDVLLKFPPPLRWGFLGFAVFSVLGVAARHL